MNWAILDDYSPVEKMVTQPGALVLKASEDVKNEYVFNSTRSSDGIRPP